MYRRQALQVLKSPSKTTNYYPYTFNKIRKNRTILFEGAVPLHEIIDYLYDFCLHFINNTSKNVDTYLSIIHKVPHLPRPQTMPILKLDGEKTKKKRKEKLKEEMPILIETIRSTIRHFVNDDDTETKNKYREDSGFNKIKLAKIKFEMEIVPRLNTLV